MPEVLQKQLLVYGEFSTAQGTFRMTYHIVLIVSDIIDHINRTQRNTQPRLQGGKGIQD